MASVRHLGLFPWCVDQETSYFKGRELANVAVPLWWRVKEWTLDVVFVRQANTSPPQISTFNFSQVFRVTDIKKNILTEDTFQNEKDLVCAGVIYDQEANQSYKIEASHLWPIEPADLFVDSFVKIGPNLELFFDQGDLAYMASSPGPEQIGTIEIQAKGIPQNLFDVAMFADTDPSGLFVPASLNGTLAATEYWPYDPNDGGGPIYDSATGEQLRAFPA